MTKKFLTRLQRARHNFFCCIGKEFFSSIRIFILSYAVMKKIVFTIMLITSFVLCADIASCADFQAVIAFDTKVDSTAYIQGGPVALSLVVSNPKAMNAYHRNVGYGEKTKIPIVTLGTETSSWIDSVKFAIVDSNEKKVDIKIRFGPTGEGVVTLGSDNFAEVYCFIIPEESGKLAAGTYSIKAQVGGVSSNELRLNVIKKKAAPATRDTVQHLLKFGRYHLLLGDFEAANRYAGQILAVDAHSLKGLILSGDALTGLGKYKQAYNIFDRAIDEYFIKYPEPEKFSVNYRPPYFLTEKMNELKKKF